MFKYDVTICGAGISGLLLASELSKSFSVVVLERSRRPQCSPKFWLTTKQSLDENHELSDCIDSQWNEMDFIAYDRSKFTAKGRYILWNTKKLENYLIEMITANGSKILYQHRFYSYDLTNTSIRSYANNSVFGSRILIDCMGYSSPIVSAANAVNILGYQHLYGRVMNLTKPINPIAVDNVIVSGTPRFLEIFPKSDGTANVVLIAPAKGTNSLGKLKSDFNFIVRDTHYSTVLSPAYVGEALHGIVPIGRVRKRALDRILFYGEAGQVHPAASCTCLNKLLLGYKKTASSLKQRIESGRVSADNLKDVVPRMSGFAQGFHQNLFKQMSHLTSHQAASFVALVQCLDQKSVDDLIFGEVGPAHFLQIANLLRVARARNTIWLKPLLRTVFNL
jgi:Lycopene cyclase protein